MSKKRLLLFCLLGPFLSLCVLRFVLASDTLDAFDPLFLVVVYPPALAMGCLPFIAAAGVDQVLEEKSLPFRPAIMLMVGFLFSFVPIAVPVILFGLWSPLVLFWGLLGGPPAAICSLLAAIGARKPAA